MITNSQISCVGKLVKPHGINGEIVVSTDCDIDLLCVKCIIINIDGINVPFFINNIRSRSQDSILITIDGIENENDASSLCGKELYLLNADLETEECDDDGFYAADLIGYTIITADKGISIGNIIDIEDSTENALFIVKKHADEIFYVPIADEFIINISQETRTVVMDLPNGLIELN